jgi:hypothetical protein
MPIDEKIGVTIVLCLLAVGICFIRTSGTWKLHSINPIRLLLAREDGTLRRFTKPILWTLIAVAIAHIWLLVQSE